MDRVRILEVVSGLGMGGAEKALINRLEYLPKFAEVTLLNVRPELNVLSLDSKFSRIDFPMGRKIFSFGFVRILTGNYAEIIVVRTPLDFIRVAIIKKFFLRKKTSLAFEIHSNFISEKRLFSFLIKLLLFIFRSQADKVFCVSDITRRGELGRLFPQASTFYLGAKQPEVGPLSEHHGVNFLFVGRMIELKRPMWLLEAIESRRDELVELKAKFIFAGNGTLLDSLRDKVKMDKLEDLVEIVGMVSNIDPLLAHSDFLISCSISEGLPLVFYEAKLSGVRVIATPSGGGEEILDSTDMVLSGFDSQEMMEAVIVACSSKISAAERHKLILANRGMSVSFIAPKYYRELIQSG